MTSFSESMFSKAKRNKGIKIPFYVSKLPHTYVPAQPIPYDCARSLCNEMEILWRYSRQKTVEQESPVSFRKYKLFYNMYIHIHASLLFFYETVRHKSFIGKLEY